MVLPPSLALSSADIHQVDSFRAAISGSKGLNCSMLCVFAVLCMLAPSHSLADRHPASCRMMGKAGGDGPKQQQMDAALPSCPPSLGCCHPKARRAQMLSTAARGLCSGHSSCRNVSRALPLGQCESSSSAGAKLL